MADRTLTINHAGGDSETYTLKTEDVLGVRVMSVDGQDVTVDRTAPDAIRGVMVDDNYSIVYDLQGEAVKTLYVDGSAITIDRSDERGEVLPYDFATYGTPEYAYSPTHDYTNTGMDIVMLNRGGDEANESFTEAEMSDGTAVAWASSGGGDGTATYESFYNQGSAGTADISRTSKSNQPLAISGGVVLKGAVFNGSSNYLQAPYGGTPTLQGDFSVFWTASVPDGSVTENIWCCVQAGNGGQANNEIIGRLGAGTVFNYNPDTTNREINGAAHPSNNVFTTSSAINGNNLLDGYTSTNLTSELDSTGVVSNVNRIQIGRRHNGNGYGESTFASLIIYESSKRGQEHLNIVKALEKKHNNNIYLLLEMGQSNSVAQSSPSVIEPYQEQDSEVLLKMSAGTDSGNNDGSINESSQTTNGAFAKSSDYLNSYGAERSFARRFQGLLGRKVAIVKFSRNGRNIARWNTTGNGNFKDFWPSYLSSAKTSLEAQGYNVKTIFHWNQGHADCQWGRGSSYQTNLETLIADVRSTVSEPDMPVIIGRTYADVNHVELPNSNETDYNNVRAAQEAVGGQANCCWYNRDSMQFRDEHTHFTREEYQREGAELVWDAYFSKFFSY